MKRNSHSKREQYYQNGSAYEDGYTSGQVSYSRRLVMQKRKRAMIRRRRFVVATGLLILICMIAGVVNIVKNIMEKEEREARLEASGQFYTQSEGDNIDVSTYTQKAIENFEQPTVHNEKSEKKSKQTSEAIGNQVLSEGDDNSSDAGNAKD